VGAGTGLGHDTPGRFLEGLASEQTDGFTVQGQASRMLLHYAFLLVLMNSIRDRCEKTCASFQAARGVAPAGGQTGEATAATGATIFTGAETI
jgi:hypothetical protein